MEFLKLDLGERSLFPTGFQEHAEDPGGSWHDCGEHEKPESLTDTPKLTQQLVVDQAPTFSGHEFYKLHAFSIARVCPVNPWPPWIMLWS